MTDTDTLRDKIQRARDTAGTLYTTLKNETADAVISALATLSKPEPAAVGEVNMLLPVWDVRRVEDCGHRGMKGYEVLLPDGTWTDVAAHSPEDAIATANLDWRAAHPLPTSSPSEAISPPDARAVVEAERERILKVRFPYIDQQEVNRAVTVHWFDVLRAIDAALQSTGAST